MSKKKQEHLQADELPAPRISSTQILADLVIADHIAGMVEDLANQLLSGVMPEGVMEECDFTFEFHRFRPRTMIVEAYFSQISRVTEKTSSYCMEIPVSMLWESV